MMTLTQNGRCRDKLETFLRQKNATVEEIVKETKVRKPSIYVILTRLIKDNIIEVKGKVRKANGTKLFNAYGIVNEEGKENEEEVSNLINSLKFLNDFFKEHISHLLKSKKIDTFIEENEDMFNKIEEMVSNA